VNRGLDMVATTAQYLGLGLGVGVKGLGFGLQG